MQYFIAAYIATPSLLIYSVSILFPKDRRVICLHCSWFRDFAFQMGEGLFQAQSSGESSGGLQSARVGGDGRP